MADRPVLNAIGPQVQKLRFLLKLTQAELAGACQRAGFDVSRETISQIERGARGVSDLEMILLSQALKVDLAQLVPEVLPTWRKDLRPPLATE